MRNLPSTSTTKVTVIRGLPGTGKTTWVQARAQRGDLIVDLDAIFAALSGLPLHDNPDELLPFACSARDAIYERLEKASDVRRAWIITSDPSAAVVLAQRFGAELMVLECPELERQGRLAQRAAIA